MIIECKLLCVDSETEELTGKETEDIFLDFAFDAEQVSYVRKIMRGEEIREDVCTISMNGILCTINLPYESVLTKWKECCSRKILSMN